MPCHRSVCLKWKTNGSKFSSRHLSRIDHDGQSLACPYKYNLYRLLPSHKIPHIFLSRSRFPPGHSITSLHFRYVSLIIFHLCSLYSFLGVFWFSLCYLAYKVRSSWSLLKTKARVSFDFGHLKSRFESAPEYINYAEACLDSSVLSWCFCLFFIKAACLVTRKTRENINVREMCFDLLFLLLIVKILVFPSWYVFVCWVFRAWSRFLGFCFFIWIAIMW